MPEHKKMDDYLSLSEFLLISMNRKEPDVIQLPMHNFDTTRDSGKKKIYNANIMNLCWFNGMKRIMHVFGVVTNYNIKERLISITRDFSTFVSDKRQLQS